MSHYKCLKKKIQNKARGSIARKLETLNSTDKTFLINVNGFLGYVKANIKVEINMENISDSVKKVPIYIISGHGENIGNIKLSRESSKAGYPIVEEKRNGHLFEMSKKDQWVIHSAPIRSLVCPSKYDQPFMDYLTSSSTNVRNILFSGNPEKLFKNVCFTQEKTTTYKSLNFSLPGMPYPRKRYWFYDSPESQSSYEWFMGVYPIFKSHICPVQLTDNKNKHRNKKEWDLNGRVFNDAIIDKLDWNGKSKLLRKYKKLTKLIKDSLPKFDKKGSKIVKEGRCVYQKEIMDIMGKGIYIDLSCSPFINLNETEVPIDKDILSIVGEKLIEEISDLNLNLWKKTYKKYRSVASLRNRRKVYKQEIFDDVGVDFGKKKTGIGISKKGRITYSTKLYEPGMYDSKKIKEKKTKESSSSELSEWTSSEE